MALVKGEKVTAITEWLCCLAESLLKADPDIVAIFQFGSSVYAPELSNDIGLFILTRQKKDFEVYCKATVGCPLNVDVVPIQLGEPIGYVGLAVRAFGKVLFGDADTVWEAIKDMPPPTFDEAKRVSEVACTYFGNALQATDFLERETHYRNAFNTLFYAARLAVVAYLATEDTRWGELLNRLPPQIEQRFREIIMELHIAIFYRRTLPLEIEGEFERWQQKISQFIEDLEKERKQH
ncbi:MAG: hypothetical protein RMK18_10330 [Armatimonadota bacterium]|nr:hypothetical protein [Armatimonadota bacterium]MCX7778401.1 hypothetical protein [Armatimonadota bacterium]MDW8026241.1 hypothetical protein [Armatimonadota bacterium]